MSTKLLRRWHAIAGNPIVARRRGQADVPTTGIIYGAQRVDGSGNPISSFYPDSTNTGVPADVSLAPTTAGADVTITTSGTDADHPFIYEARYITGRIFVQADYVLIRYCEIVGRSSGYGMIAGSGSDTALVVQQDGKVGLVVEQCTLHAQTASVFINGVRGRNFTLIRNRIYNVVDWADIFSTGSSNDTVNLNVYTYGNYLSDLMYISPDPNHTTDNRTHNDGIQIPQNGGLYMLGDRVEAFASTSMGSGYNGVAPPTATNPYLPSVTGQCVGITTSKFIWNEIWIDGCWFAGGAQSITWIKGGVTGTHPTTHKIVNNVFKLNSNPSISKSGTAARRPMLIDTTIPIPNIPTTADLNGIRDTTIALGGSNNRYDDGTFAHITRMVNAA